MCGSGFEIGVSSISSPEKEKLNPDILCLVSGPSLKMSNRLGWEAVKIIAHVVSQSFELLHYSTSAKLQTLFTLINRLAGCLQFAIFRI